jgi:hypothetical protein
VSNFATLSINLMNLMSRKEDDMNHTCLIVDFNHEIAGDTTTELSEKAVRCKRQSMSHCAVMPEKSAPEMMADDLLRNKIRFDDVNLLP